jgi:integrative and conjugative element protein (TIGR02256 family)
MPSNSELTESSPRLFVVPDVLTYITDLVRAETGRETGGILIGFHQGRDIRIVKASDAGPLARRSSCGFLRDTGYCQAILDQEHAASGADYVGEWHTHVVDLARPSEGDIATLAGIILDPDYSFLSFSMLLVIRRAEAVEVQAYAVTADAERSDRRRSRTRVVRVCQVTPEVAG